MGFENIRLRDDQPKGIICGETPIPGARYEQGGYYFRANGECLGPSGPVKAPAEVEPVVVQVSETAEAVDETVEKTPTMVEMVVAMRNEGWNATEIADHLNMNGETVSRQKVSAIIRRNPVAG